MIIADDELLIRQGLLTMPWKDYGIEIVGVASNGEEALKLVKSSEPDILLTDIRMPGMDGLKLIETAKQTLPDIKAILLTGYQDFSYAHHAIQLGAYGYVLKPSDPDEIISIVLRAKKQVEEEINEKNKKEEIIQKVNEAKKVIKDSFLQDLIYERISDKKIIIKKCNEYNLLLKNYVVMLIEFETRDATLNYELKNYIKEEIRFIISSYNEFYAMDINHSTYLIICELDLPGEQIKDKMLLLAMELKNVLKMKFDIYVSIGISRLGNSSENLHAVFNQAMNCLKMKFSLGKGAVIHIDELMDSLKRQDIFISKHTDELLDNIRTGNYRKVEELTRELLYKLAKVQKADEQMIKSICFDILLSSLRILKEDKTYLSRELSEQEFHSKITDCTDVTELEEYLLNTLMNLMDTVHSKTPLVKNKVINDIIDYIDRFYMKDISLITVSEYVFMNHIYVSRLIKRETGETFLDILTRKRMNKACELLANTNFKTYEISEMIGIKDSGYFSQVFKKYNGVTPSEYKENLYSRNKCNKEVR